MTVRADIAELIHAGATYQQIKAQLHVSQATISSVRRELGIQLPPGRAKRTRAELASLEESALVMLRDGATYQEIYKALRVSLNVISRLRKEHQIPVPHRDRAAATRLSVDEVFALYTQPSTTGEHLLWTGPRSGRGVDLLASGRKYNARAIAFSKHHGRDPDGRLWRTCDLPDCISGAHHTDHRIRQANARADRAFDAIFGAAS
jgi:uncharacterized protein YerC